MQKNKWQRIQYIKELNLNTEESVFLETKKIINKFPQEVIDFIEKHKKFSLRTFNDKDNDNHPHYPVISKKQLLDLIPDLIRKEFNLIIAICIDPKYAELCGCAYKRGKSITLEIKYGAFTVREITHKGNIDKTVSTGFLTGTSTGDRRLDIIVSELRHLPVDECIFEFSWYLMPIGWRHQKQIYWEITGAQEKGKIFDESGLLT